MGTNAIVYIDKVSVCLTHWDGYPSGLGQTLLGIPNPTPKRILEEVEDGYHIDAEGKGLTGRNTFAEYFYNWDSKKKEWTFRGYTGRWKKLKKERSWK